MWLCMYKTRKSLLCTRRPLRSTIVYLHNGPLRAHWPRGRWSVVRRGRHARLEGRHALWHSIGQNELLPQLDVGASLGWWVAVVTSGWGSGMGFVWLRGPINHSQHNRRRWVLEFREGGSSKQRASKVGGGGEMKSKIKTTKNQNKNNDKMYKIQNQRLDASHQIYKI